MTIEVHKFAPQGKILIALRTAGVPGIFNETGCADDLSVSFSTDRFQHKETCTGQHGIDAEGITGNTGTIATTLTDFTVFNMLLALSGTLIAAATTPTSVSAEVLPTGITVGQYAALGGATPHQNITSLVLTDSTPSTPITLVLGTDYVVDVGAGTVQFLTIPGTQPYKAAYSHQNDAQIALLTAGQNEYYFRFNAINTQNSNKLSIVELYRVRFDPTSKFDLLPAELSTFPLSGSLLLDSTKPFGGQLGQYGRISLPA